MVWAETTPRMIRSWTNVADLRQCFRWATAARSPPSNFALSLAVRSVSDLVGEFVILVAMTGFISPDRDDHFA